MNRDGSIVYPPGYQGCPVHGEVREIAQDVGLGGGDEKQRTVPGEVQPPQYRDEPPMSEKADVTVAEKRVQEL